jgi:hypothetical protein
MRTLREKIKSMMETDDPIIHHLNYDELNYINYFMNELNKSGRQHSIVHIYRNNSSIDIETKYSD